MKTHKCMRNITILKLDQLITRTAIECRQICWPEKHYLAVLWAFNKCVLHKMITNNSIVSKKYLNMNEFLSFGGTSSPKMPASSAILSITLRKISPKYIPEHIFSNICEDK